MPPKNPKRLAPVVPPKVNPNAMSSSKGPKRRDRAPSPPPKPPLVPPPPKSPPVDLAVLQQQMGQFQAFMLLTQSKAAELVTGLPSGVAALPAPLTGQRDSSSGSKKKVKKSPKSKKGPKSESEQSKTVVVRPVSIASSSGSESSGSESESEGDGSGSEKSGSSSGVSSRSSDSSRNGRGKKRRHRRNLKLFKSRPMKKPDAGALAAAMLKWDAGVTLVGYGAMSLFQGVVTHLDRMNPSKNAKKRKLGTLEHLQLHTGSELASTSLPEKFAGYVLEMVPVKIVRRLCRDSRVNLSLDHYWEKNKGNFVTPDAVCRAGGIDAKRRLATFAGSGFELIELHSTIAMVMSIVDPVHGLALQALTRVLSKLLAAGYSAPVAIRYASTIHAELALDAARKSTYGKCFSIDLPTLAVCNVEPSTPAPVLPPSTPRLVVTPIGMEVPAPTAKSGGACYAFNSRDGCSKGQGCGFQHHCRLCKSVSHGKDSCPTGSRDHRRTYDRGRR